MKGRQHKNRTETAETRETTTEELFARLKSGDETARQALLDKNRGLVIRLANNYRYKTRLSIRELISEGDLGLLTAIHKFEPTRATADGVKFSTYAYWWIRRNIIRALIKNQSLISVPEHISELLRQYRQNERKLVQLMGRAPTEAEIANVLGLPPEQLKNVLRRNILTEVSLNKPVSPGKPGPPLEDFLGKVLNLEDQFLKKEQVERLFRCLTTLEKKALTLRFGLNETPAFTYREIAERLEPKKQLSRQRIYQIVRVALEKLRRQAKEAGMSGPQSGLR